MPGPDSRGPAVVGGLQTDANLFDFFLGHVTEAVEDHAVPVGEDSVWYLTSLLVERAHPTREPRQEPATLAELHLQAREGDRSTAIRAYRALGDRALVTAGFFHRSLSRKLVSRQYYLDMGAAAYDTLAGLLRAAGFGRAQVVGEGAGRGLDAVYDELAQAFEACTEVLDEVREAVRDEVGRAASDADIVALYEEWLRSGSPRLAARLQALGVVPVRSDGWGQH